MVIILFCLYAVFLSVLKYFSWYIYVKENGSGRPKDSPFNPVALIFILHSLFAFYPFLIVILFTYIKIYKYYKISSENPNKGADESPKPSTSRTENKKTISDTLNKVSEKGLNKNFIIVLHLKMFLILLCKLTFIVYKSVTLFFDKSSLLEQVEFILKSFGWVFTLFMFSDYILRNEYFKKGCKNFYDFCCKCNSSLTVLKLL